MPNTYERLNLIFVRIPKTGSTAINSWLKQYGEAKARHYTAMQLKRIVGDDWINMTSFAILRNPWDRMVSIYYALRDRNKIDADMSFDEFVCGKVFVNAWKAVRPRVLLHQHEYVLDDAGAIAVTTLGRFENLQGDFAKIVMDAAGVSVPVLSRTRTTRPRQHADYRTIYTENAAKVIASVFAKDVEIGEYTF